LRWAQRESERELDAKQPEMIASLVKMEEKTTEKYARSVLHSPPRLFMSTFRQHHSLCCLLVFFFSLARSLSPYSSLVRDMCPSPRLKRSAARRRRKKARREPTIEAEFMLAAPNHGGSRGDRKKDAASGICGFRLGKKVSSHPDRQRSELLIQSVCFLRIPVRRSRA
jgi:hypothetical protein